MAASVLAQGVDYKVVARSPRAAGSPRSHDDFDPVAPRSRRRPPYTRAPHPGRRIRPRLRLREEPRVLDARRPERPGVPGFHDVLRVQPDRVQPPEDEGSGVPPRPAPRRPAQAGRWRTSTASNTPRSWTRSPGWPSPRGLPHAFFIEGGALAVENALKVAFDWKVRRNRARGISGGPGHAGHPLPRGVPRAQRVHAVADQHRPREDRPVPPVPLAAHRQPEAALPGHARGGERRGGGRGARARPGTAGLRGQPGRHRRHPHRADPGRGRGQPLPRRLPAGARAAGRRERVLLHRGRGADGHRHHRPHVGVRALRPRLPTPWPSARRRRSAAAWPGPRWTRSRRTSSRCPRASTRPGAAGSPTWCAARATWRSSRRTGWSTTRAWWASTCSRGLQQRAGRAAAA